MSKKILMIEDEKSMIDLFSRIIEDERPGEYIIESATDGKSGLEMITKSEYEAVLLDLIMEEFDGIAVLKELAANKAKYPNTPIIVLTNLATSNRKEEVMGSGANVVDFIDKSADPGKLIAALESTTKK